MPKPIPSGGFPSREEPVPQKADPDQGYATPIHEEPPKLVEEPATEERTEPLPLRLYLRERIAARKGGGAVSDEVVLQLLDELDRFDPPK